MPYNNETRQEIKESIKYLSCGVRAVRMSNPSDLKVGERVKFLGHSAYTYRECEIVLVERYEWGVRYYLQGVKKDGSLGEYKGQTDSHYSAL